VCKSGCSCPGATSGDNQQHDPVEVNASGETIGWKNYWKKGREDP